MQFCLARHATDPHFFGDGTHKYYLEKRCGAPRHPDADVCIRCMVRTSCQQRSRLFPHGKVNEWIPASSHIYGGSWFAEGVKRWGAPPLMDLQHAETYQYEARQGFDVPPQWCLEDLNNVRNNTTDMPKKADGAPRAPRKKKDLAAPAAPATPPAAISSEPATPPTATTAAPAAIPRPRKKAVPPQAIAALPTTHRDILLPTHLEVAERFDAEGFEVEIVPLTRFEHDGSLYFRSGRNKLYRQLRGDKIGDYVGRYDPMTDRICRDVEDSDREE